MRPRKTNFGKIYFKDLEQYLNYNKVYGMYVKRGDPLLYTFLIMFRKTKEPPEKLFIEVSSTSKLVLSIYTEKRKFQNIKEVFGYITLK